MAINSKYTYLLNISNKSISLHILYVLSLLESIILIIPVETFISALLLSTSKFSAKYISLVATIGSVSGGAIAYFIGYFAWESIGIYILDNLLGFNFELIDHRQDIQISEYIVKLLNLNSNYVFEIYDNYSMWLVAIFAILPLPYKLIALTSGAAHSSFLAFIVISFLARGVRFLLVALLVDRFKEAFLQVLAKFNKIFIYVSMFAVAILLMVMYYISSNY